MVHERTIGSKGKGLWGMKGEQLPAYMQHVYNDMVQGGSKPGSHTYRLAVGIVENWAEGHDGHGNKVSAATKAKAAAAVTEWERLKAKAHAREAATPEARRAAERLLAALRGDSLRARDRAAVLAGRLAGERPRDHAHAADLMEALADSSCGSGGCADAPAEKPAPPEPALAEAKNDEKKDGSELDAEVARLKKKGMPHKLAYKAACKKLGVKEAAEPAEGHSRLAPRLVEGPVPFEATHHPLGAGKFDKLKHPRGRGGEFAGKALAPMKGETSNAYGDVDPADTSTGKQLKRHSRLAARRTEFLPFIGASVFYDPKTGPSEEQMARNAERMGKKPKR